MLGFSANLELYNGFAPVDRRDKVDKLPGYLAARLQNCGPRKSSTSSNLLAYLVIAFRFVMVSSKPPLAWSRNSTLLDNRIPAPQGPADSGTGLRVLGSGSQITPDPLWSLSVPSTTLTNQKRDGLRSADMKKMCICDETFMGMDDYLAMATAPGKASNLGQDSPAPG